MGIVAITAIKPGKHIKELLIQGPQSKTATESLSFRAGREALRSLTLPNSEYLRGNPQGETLLAAGALLHWSEMGSETLQLVT